MNSNRRAWMRTAAMLAVAGRFGRAGAAWPESRDERTARMQEAVPVLLLRQGALAESRRFAAAWPDRIALRDLGPDIGETLFGPMAVGWHALRGPVIGLTTPDALFCLEQMAAACGVRTVVRVMPAALAGSSADAAVTQLRAALRTTSQWAPLPLVFPADSGPWIAWLMAPRAALRLDN